VTADEAVPHQCFLSEGEVEKKVTKAVCEITFKTLKQNKPHPKSETTFYVL
jgi:hypothetical protein